MSEKPKQYHFVSIKSKPPETKDNNKKYRVFWKKLIDIQRSWEPKVPTPQGHPPQEIAGPNKALLRETNG